MLQDNPDAVCMCTEYVEKGRESECCVVCYVLLVRLEYTGKKPFAHHTS